MPDKPKLKIIWSVDALSGDLVMLKKTVRLIELMSKKVDCEVEPVSVFTPPNPYLERRGYSNLMRQTEEDVRARLEKLMPKVPIKGAAKVLPPHFISQPTFSARKAVCLLSDYAVKQGADLILASTHARSGLSRALMGSFVETLIQFSEVPVLMANVKTRTPTGFKSILFPTDLSDDSKKIFESLLGFAKAFGSKITLYHKLQWGAEYVALFASVPLYTEYVKEDGKARTDRAQDFVKIAKDSGVKCDVIIDKKSDGIAEGIGKAAKKLHPNLVALTSDTGPVASVLLGSITRSVMRQMPCPVWVLKSRRKP